MFDQLSEHLGLLAILLAFVAGVLQVAAVLSAIHAVMASRTSQGAIAWAMFLLVFPLPVLSLPVYWTFGRSRFEGYFKARREGDTAMHEVVRGVGQEAKERGLVRIDATGNCAVLERLAWMPFLLKNRVELLIDGQATFDAIFAGIESAQE